MTRKVSDVTAIVISLDINAKGSLFVLVGADGSINRSGRGTMNNTEIDLCIGMTDPAIFEAVRDHLTEDMLECEGQTLQHKTPPRGAPCKLDVIFQFNDGTSGGFTFLYGAVSAGPPRHVVDLVRTAVSQTDPWYALQLGLPER